MSARARAVFCLFVLFFRSSDVGDVVPVVGDSRLCVDFRGIATAAFC